MLLVRTKTAGQKGAFALDDYRMWFSSQLATSELVGYGDRRNWRAQAVEYSRTADPARAAAAAVGRAPARRLTQADGDARPADRAAGPGGQSRSSTRQNGAASANPARGGCDHRPGLRADPGRCQPLPARQAGGQLPGPDSARALLGRTAEAGCDHQAGQPHAAHVAGGSGADRGASMPISTGAASCS